MTSKYDINPERDSEAKVTNIHTIRKTPKVALNYLTALKSPKLQQSPYNFSLQMGSTSKQVQSTPRTNRGDLTLPSNHSIANITQDQHLQDEEYIQHLRKTLSYIEQSNLILESTRQKNRTMYKNSLDKMYWVRDQLKEKEGDLAIQLKQLSEALEANMRRQSCVELQ